MTQGARAEPPFDPRWLDLLSEHVAAVSQRAPRLQDLYLERRLEVRVSHHLGTAQMEICSGEGTAARWHQGGRDLLHATAGTTPRAVADLLAGNGDPRQLALARPVPPAEMDAPRGWSEWARELVSRMASLHPEVIFFNRQGVTIRADGWHLSNTPPLVRVRCGAKAGAALLAVWRHPQLSEWLKEVFDRDAARGWSPPSSTRLPVLLSHGTSGGLLHEIVGHFTESDLAIAGDSPLAGLGGALLSAATLSLVDDPTRHDLPGAFSHDDEGVPAVPITLLEGGRLAGWLCDLRGAGALSCAPGRGRRAAWTTPPVPRLSNLVASPGENDPADMERDLKLGLLVTRIGGATVDPVSTRTVVHVERGWEIKNGRRRRPLAPFTLSGTVLDILGSVDAGIGSDSVIDWRLGWCVKNGIPMPTGSAAPTILVHGLEVL